MQVGEGASGSLQPALLNGDLPLVPSGPCGSGASINGRGKQLLAIRIPGGTAAGGVLTVDVCGAAFDSMLWVGRGCPDDGADFGCIAGDDDTCGPASRVQVTTEDNPGGFFYALVGSYGASQGVYTLS